MVRTAATAVRASGGRSSKAVKTSTLNSSYSSSSDRHGIGGNPAHPREIPTWQKPITNFFSKQPENTNIEKCSGQQKENELKVDCLGERSCITDVDNETLRNKEEIYGENSNNENIAGQCANLLEDENATCTNAVANEKTKSDSENEDSTVPKKKPNEDFYKRLEEIENYVR
ncbi:hypothetical protein AMK59_324 [Oryctes borbonicus]|uniref:PCNA-associated factor histone-like domain-containing protein n=1 Tax=Oryctes borbonicus TaxID=1629725 RepID=A0A0T6BDT3_9SCAR|nr:hypothetical protein AMK59_324 [Oryctes borbonicus]